MPRRMEPMLVETGPPWTGRLGPMFRGHLGPLRTRWAYRIDRLLRLHGSVQILILVGITFSVILMFAAVLGVSGGAPETRSAADFLWWAIGRFSDGGTMYSDQEPRVRVIAVAVTWTGIFLVQFMTGAFTAKLTDRLDQLRSGNSPVVERHHVLVLGFDAKVPLIARELARSHQRHVLVVLADKDLKLMDAHLQSARQIPGNRLRIETRTGDPQDEYNLLRVSADYASAILIVPPDELDDRAAQRWTFATLLAVRRILGESFDGHVIVESRHRGKEYALRAAMEPPPAHTNAPPVRLIPIAGDDIISRVLAQSIRQVGVYHVLRELLSFRGSELYFEPVPRSLANKRFSEVHARITEGIAVGYKPQDGPPLINPNDDVVIRATDEIIVLQTDQGRFEIGHTPILPEPEAWQPPDASKKELPMRVYVLGDNRALPEFTDELASTLPDGSHICIVNDLDQRSYEDLAERERVTIVHRRANPVDLARNPPDEMFDADAVVVLGAGSTNDLTADAAALETLVCLRHAERERGRRLERLVTELRNLGSAMHVAGTQHDFVVSSEILGLLMAQLAVNPGLETALYRDILDPGGNDVFIRPRAYYGPDGPLTFAQVMRSARLRGEVAIGICRATAAETSPNIRRLLEGKGESDEISPVRLVPPRDENVPGDAMVVVFARA
jgi:hypothetical protein